ncbi:chain-length determining protein [Brevundimonas sp. CEF1]|uniref:chain-length determining protein n=1 Tax=Brevundimonas sp. CEF1 TaxID=3442642 RepID=UPI003F510E73
MADQSIKYLGPVAEAVRVVKKRSFSLKNLPFGFLIIVALPTLLAAIYYLLIASPRYVSEARFVVRSPSTSQPSSLGAALQGVGFSTGMNDAYAVHEYMASRDGLNALKQRHDIERILGAEGVDIFSRYPHPWQSRSDEALFKALQRYLTVGYNSASGISTIRVQAFKPADAQALNSALLDSAEALINRLNDRAASNAVKDAQESLSRAQQEVTESQLALTSLRNSAQFIDPRAAAAESSEVISGLLVALAQLRAERAQLSAEAPSSPQLTIIDNRIRAYEQQVAEARASVSGKASSLAPKVGAYEELMLRKEIADKQMAQATAALLSAEQEARRQKLYLERIVTPSLPDKPSEPRRWMAILTVFASTMLAYGVGWLLWAGVREHKQA